LRSRSGRPLLEGASLRPDDDATKEVYGRKMTARNIVTGKRINVPAVRGPFRRCARKERAAQRVEQNGESITMRFIHLFLIGYSFLALGVGLALWQTGVLRHVAPIWMSVGALVTIGMGIMLSVASGKPAVSQERR
jgi:hypothetical protein